MNDEQLSYTINGCAMYVHNEIGPGHMEYIYCRALAVTFRKKGIAFEREAWLPIYFEQYAIGYRRADFVVENRLIIEVKALKGIDDSNMAQTFSTLKALNRSEALLLNFGASKLQHKHIYYRHTRPDTDFMPVMPEMVGEENDDLFEARPYLPTWVVERMQRERLKQGKR